MAFLTALTALRTSPLQDEKREHTNRKQPQQRACAGRRGARGRASRQPTTRSSPRFGTPACLPDRSHRAERHGGCRRTTAPPRPRARLLCVDEHGGDGGPLAREEMRGVVVARNETRDESPAPRPPRACRRGTGAREQSAPRMLLAKISLKNLFYLKLAKIGMM